MSEAVSAFSVTHRAATKVKDLIAAEKRDNLMLRVYITGGGCSGFQYGFDFEQELSDGDMEIEQGGVKIIIDPMSYQYLLGAELDFKEDMMGSQFVINNPNAQTTCGCGSSFSV